MFGFCRDIKYRTEVIGPTLLAAFVLWFTTDGRAADYSLAYGIRLNGMRDTGILDQCNVEQPCVIRSDRLGLVITVRASGPVTWLANVRISYQGTCCLFSGGEDTHISPVGTDLISIPIYEGKRRLQNEAVVNIPVGTLWLAFARK